MFHSLPCFKYILRNIDITDEHSLHIFEKTYLETVIQNNVSPSIYKTELYTFPQKVHSKTPLNMFIYKGNTLSMDSLIDTVLNDSNIPSMNCQKYYSSIDSNCTCCQLCPLHIAEDGVIHEKTIFTFALSCEKNFETLNNEIVGKEKDLFTIVYDAYETISSKEPYPIPSYILYYSLLENIKNIFRAKDLPYGPLTKSLLYNLEKYNMVAQSGKKLSTTSAKTFLVNYFEDIPKNDRQITYTTIQEILSHLQEPVINEHIDNVSQETPSQDVIFASDINDSEHITNDEPIVNSESASNTDNGELEISDSNSDENYEYTDASIVTDSGYSDAFIDENNSRNIENDGSSSSAAIVPDDYFSVEPTVDADNSNIDTTDKSELDNENLSTVLTTDGMHELSSDNDISDYNHPISALDTIIEDNVEPLPTSSTNMDDYNSFDTKNTTDVELPIINCEHIKRKYAPSLNDCVLDTYIPLEYLAAFAIELTDNRAVLSDFENTILRDGNILLEAIYDQNNKSYLLIYSSSVRRYYFADLNLESIRVLLKPYFMKEKFPKVIFQPYRLYSLCKEYNLGIRGVISLYTAYWSLYPAPCSNDYNKILCHLSKRTFQLNGACYEKLFDGLTIYKSIYRIYNHSLKKKIYTEEQKKLYHEQQSMDMLLGQNYLLSQSLQTTNTLFKLEGFNQYIYNTELCKPIFPGCFMKYSLVTDNESTTKYVLHQLLLQMLIGGRFQKNDIFLVAFVPDGFTLFLPLELKNSLQTIISNLFFDIGSTLKYDKFNTEVQIFEANPD